MKKNVSFITVGVFALLLFGFSLAFWILPDQSFSAEENRSLRTLPDFSFEKLASGEYAEQINDYFADQFPLRDSFVGIKGISEIALGKGENNGILLGEDGQLAKRLFDVRRADGTAGVELDTFDPENIRLAAEGIDRVSETLDMPFTVLLTGRTLDVTGSAFDYPSDGSNALLETLYQNVNADVSVVDTVPLFREKYQAGEYVYYKTDHHWTTLGAYYAYAELMAEWGMEDDVLPPEAFERQTVAADFYGTLWSAGGMKFVPSDSLELWTLGNEADFTVTADGKLLEGFYSKGYLAKKDKYSVFLDGTHDVVTVTKNTGEQRQTLVLFKDSFANSLAPFLAQHFDLVLLNLSSTRTDYTDITAYVAEYNADRVLLIYTLENVVTTGKLGALR